MVFSGFPVGALTIFCGYCLLAQSKDDVPAFMTGCVSMPLPADAQLLERTGTHGPGKFSAFTVSSHWTWSSVA